MLIFGRKILKNCRFVCVTTLIFFLNISKSIDLCKLNLDIDRSPMAAKLNETRLQMIQPISQTGKFAKCAKETDRLLKTCAYKF